MNILIVQSFQTQISPLGAHIHSLHFPTDHTKFYLSERSVESMFPIINACMWVHRLNLVKKSHLENPKNPKATSNEYTFAN